MKSDVVFRYVGGGAYRIGLPTRDLLQSDMQRAAKQGWPAERIEAELPGLYEPVKPEPEPEPEPEPVVEVEPEEEVFEEINEEVDDAVSIL